MTTDLGSAPAPRLLFLSSIYERRKNRKQPEVSSHEDQEERLATLGEGAVEHFTGAVRVDPLIEAPEPARVISLSGTSGNRLHKTLAASACGEMLAGELASRPASPHCCPAYFFAVQEALRAGDVISKARMSADWFSPVPRPAIDPDQRACSQIDLELFRHLKFGWILSVLTTYLAYNLYARRIERNIIQPDAKRATPARMYMDGADFMPTSRNMLFGYHFEAIASAGPIVGPITAVNLWGWAPSLAWLIIGVGFIGWASDYSAIVVAVRNEGNSLSAIAHRLIASRAMPCSERLRRRPCGPRPLIARDKSVASL